MSMANPKIKKHNYFALDLLNIGAPSGNIHTIYAKVYTSGDLVACDN
jgi:hypothetical protein